MTSSEILTSIVAVYGAGLSTYVFVLSRREKRRRIRVDLSMGGISGPTSTGHVVMLTITNPGNRTVTLSGVSIELPGDLQLGLFHSHGNVTLPHDLEEGKKCEFWIPVEELCGMLGAHDYSGKIRLVGVVRDAVGTRYRSNGLGFDIGSWLRE